MTFAYIKGSLAAWANNTTISQADAWQLDQNQKNAIDGAAGGAYAPSGTITIGGAGLSVSSTATFSGLVNCTGNVNLGNNSGDTINVYGIANLSAGNVYGYLSMYAGAYFGGTGSTYALDPLSELIAYGNVTIGTASSASLTIGATITASSSATFNSTVTMNGNVALGNAASDLISCAGSATFAATTTVNGSFVANNTVTIGGTSADIAYLNAVLHTQGTGSIQLDFIQLDDANHTITAGSPHIILQGAMSANRELRLNNPTVGTGAPFKFIRCTDAAYYVTVEQENGTSIFALGNGYGKSAIVYHNGSVWQPIMYGT